MSFLNQAYRILKNPNLLRGYLLKIEGIQSARQAVPVELSEAWFEIQDLMTESLEQAKNKLFEFEIELKQQKKQMEQDLLLKEKSFDLTQSTQILKEIAVDIQIQSYLESLEKDVERIKKNAYTNK